MYIHKYLHKMCTNIKKRSDSDPSFFKDKKFKNLVVLQFFFWFRNQWECVT